MGSQFCALYIFCSLFHPQCDRPDLPQENSNHIQTCIQELMQNGEFEPLCQDFQSTDAAFYDGLGLAVSPHYLLDFSNLQYGFSVYPSISFIMF